MIYYSNNQWHIATEQINYIHNGEEETKPVGIEGHQWWVDFADKWTDMEIISFIPIDTPEAAQNRLREVNELKIDNTSGYAVALYVEEGVFPEGHTHPLRELESRLIQEANEDYLVDIDFRLSMTELGM